MARKVPAEIVKFRQRLDIEGNRLESQRMSDGWDAQWLQIKEYLLPDRGRNLNTSNSPDTEYNQGEWSRASIIDDVPERAMGIASNGMMEGMTSQTRPWFKMGPEGPMDGVPRSHLVWYDMVTESIRGVFNRSNLYKVLPGIYKELLGFGTHCSFLETDPIETINIKSFTVGEYYLLDDPRGRIQKAFRNIYMTAENIIQQFGEDNCPPVVVEAAKGDKTFNKAFQVRHVIMPASKDVPVKDILGRPWLSVYYVKDAGVNEGLLGVRGYSEDPILAPRWDIVSNDVYGKECPGMVSLGNVRMLQKEQEQKLIALDKKTNPPLLSEDESAVLDTFPGGVSYTQGVAGNRASIQQLYDVNFDVASVSADIQEVQASIREAFFNDFFLLVGRKTERMTATEVMELQSEKLMMLAPVFQRITDEFIEPLIDRTFWIMARQGLLPEPPPDLDIDNIKIEHISLLAQAQKAATVRSIESSLGFAVQVAAIAPGVLDNFDFDKAVIDYNDLIGAPASHIKDPAIVAAIREQKAQQEAMAQQMEMMNAAAQGAETMSKAQVGNNSVLDALLGRPLT